MAKPSDFLFQLIKSLKSSEKRYFQVYTRIHSNFGEETDKKKYVQLFEEILQMEVYNEESLKLRYPNLAQDKKYLEHQLLKSMRAYSSEKDPKAQLDNHLRDARILRERKAYPQALRTLRKAKQLAKEIEDYGVWAEILHTMRALQLEIMGHKDFKKLNFEWDEGMKEEIWAGNQLQKLISFRQVYHQVFEILRREGELTPTVRKDELDKVMFAPGFNLAPTESSFQIRLYYLLAWGAYARFSKDFTLAFQHFKDALALWKAHPHQAKYFPNQYRILLGNYLISSHMIGNYEDFDRLIPEIKKLPVDSLQAEIESFQTLYFLELIHHMNQRNWKAAKKLEAKIHRGLYTTYADRVIPSRQIALMINLAFVNLYVKDFEMGLKWVKGLLNNRALQQLRLDIVPLAQILEIICYFEMGETYQLEYTIRNYRRKIKKGNRLDNFRSKVFTVFKRILNATDEQEKTILFQSLIEEEELRDEGIEASLGLEELKIYFQNAIS